MSRINHFRNVQIELNKIIWEHHAPSEENARVVPGSYDFGVRLAFGGALDDKGETYRAVEVSGKTGAFLVQVERLPTCETILPERTVYQLDDRFYEPCVTEESLMLCVSSPQWWQYLMRVHIEYNRLTNDESSARVMKENAFKRVSRVTALLGQLERLQKDHGELPESDKARAPLFYSVKLVQAVKNMVELFNKLSPGVEKDVINSCTQKKHGQYCLRNVHTNKANVPVVSRMSLPLSQQLHLIKTQGLIQYACQMPDSKEGNATLTALGQFMLEERFKFKEQRFEKAVIGQCRPSTENEPFKSEFLEAEQDALKTKKENYEVLAQPQCTADQKLEEPPSPTPLKPSGKQPPLLSQTRNAAATEWAAEEQTPDECRVERTYVLPPNTIQKAINNKEELLNLDLKDPTLVDARQVDGMYKDYTILMGAAKMGKIDMIKFLCASENEYYPDPFLVILKKRNNECMTARKLVDTCNQCAEEVKDACKAHLKAYEEYYSDNQQIIENYKTQKMHEYEDAIRREAQEAAGREAQEAAVKLENDNIAHIVKTLLTFVEQKKPDEFARHFTNLTKPTRERVANLRIGAVLPDNYPFFKAYEDKTLLERALKKGDGKSACKLLRAGADKMNVGKESLMADGMREVLDKGKACDDPDAPRRSAES